MNKEALIIKRAKEVAGKTGIPFHICVIRICKEIGEDYHHILSVAGKRSAAKKQFSAVTKELSQQLKPQENTADADSQLTFGFGG